MKKKLEIQDISLELMCMLDDCFIKDNIYKHICTVDSNLIHLINYYCKNNNIDFKYLIITYISKLNINTGPSIYNANLSLICFIKDENNTEIKLSIQSHYYYSLEIINTTIFYTFKSKDKSKVKSVIFANESILLKENDINDIANKYNKITKGADIAISTFLNSVINN